MNRLTNQPANQPTNQLSSKLPVLTNVTAALAALEGAQLTIQRRDLQLAQVAACVTSGRYINGIWGADAGAIMSNALGCTLEPAAHRSRPRHNAVMIVALPYYYPSERPVTSAVTGDYDVQWQLWVCGQARPSTKWQTHEQVVRDMAAQGVASDPNACDKQQAAG